jgi:hypothetical protein
LHGAFGKFVSDCIDALQQATLMTPYVQEVIYLEHLYSKVSSNFDVRAKPAAYSTKDYPSTSSASD